MINKLFKKYTLAKVCVFYLVFVFMLLISKTIKSSPYPELEGKKLTLIGTVSSIEEKASPYGESSTIISLKSISSAGNLPTFKGLLVTLDQSQSCPLLGETVMIRGVAENFKQPNNPGEFNALNYYRALGYNMRIKSATILRGNLQANPIYNFLFHLRLHLANILDKVCKKDSGLMRSILLGDKSNLDPAQKQLFVDGGIGHIIAISGLHISFLGLGLYKILKGISIPLFSFSRSRDALSLPKPFCVFFSVSIMFMYGILTGGSPSAIRAIIMFSLYLFADLLGRTYDQITAITLAACIICLIEPRLLFQSAFQLSFGAIIGIVFMHPLITSLWNNKPFNCLAISIAVTLVTLPAQLSSFYQYPLYSLLLNLIVVPLMGVCMLAGIGALIFGELNIAIGSIVFFPGSLCLHLFQYLCQFQSKLPYHCIITGKPQPWQIILYYGILLFLLLSMGYEYYSLDSKVRIQGLLTKPVVLSTLILALIIISRTWVFHSYMYVMDVGQGDWIIFRDTHNHCITIDGGSSSEKKIYDYTILPSLKALGIRKIDYMVFSHTDSDHVSGSLALLEQSASLPISVKKIVIPPQWASYESENYDAISTLAKANNIPLFQLSKGKSFTCGALSFRVLWPDPGNKQGDINGDCLVIRADVRDSARSYFSVLLTGDLDGDAEQNFIKKAQDNYPELVDIDILKVGHHASKVSSSDDLLQLATPNLAIISVGKNSYGHPSDDCMKRLSSIPSFSSAYTTQVSGAIRISTADPLSPAFFR